MKDRQPSSSFYFHWCLVVFRGGVTSVLECRKEKKEKANDVSPKRPEEGKFKF